MTFNSHDVWTDTEQAYWLACDRIAAGGLNARRMIQVYDMCKTLRPLWELDRDTLGTFEWYSRDVHDTLAAKKHGLDPEKILEEFNQTGFRAYPFAHPEFPFRLREIYEPPLVLYMRGGLHPDELGQSCAIVGTRRPTAYGQRNAKEFSRQLGSTGVTVVSGMAIGIDSFAHWGAIEGGGKTVAVSACGIDICYPSSNKPLFKHLTEDRLGAVVSEFYPGTRPEKWRFPARNRIISGLARACLVIEAGETSGSLITARMAFEQDREVFAIPGRLDAPMSRGTNLLIKKLQAHLCLEPGQILEECRWAQSSPVRDVPTVVELYGRERELYQMISPEPVHFDYLCEKSGMPAPELSATLTMLELAGVVSRLPGDWYTREYALAAGK